MKELRIVLVEDDEWDIDLMRYSLKQRNIPFELEVYNHGVAAARFFEHVNLIPDIIILDVNLPGIAGTDLLKLVKQNALLQNTPVLILTTADNPQYKELALRDGASKFITKVMQVKEMNTVIDTILEVTGRNQS